MTRPLPRWLLVVHWALILNFLVNMIYGSYQLFVVLAPEGGAVGPLWGAAASLPFEQLVARRLYAIEVWVSTAGLAVYLGLTEVLPRRLPPRS